MLRFSSFLLIVLLAGCSSARVLNTEKAEGIDLTAYKTFDFYKVEASGDTVSAQYNERLQQLEDAIAVNMQHFGYLLSKTNPDLLINIGVVVREQVQTRQTDFRNDAPRYAGQRNYSWKSQEVEVGSYREGTVTVHMVDPKQKKLVWQGTVEDVIPQRRSGVEKTINKGVKKLFASFPVARK